MSDPEIKELKRDQHLRWVLVVSAITGILAGTALGLAFSFGVLDAPGAYGYRSPASLIFFVGPFAACMAVGALVHRIAGVIARRG